jgi:two-component system CitB family sensor kinase
VLLNLLSNACKHTEVGEVVLSVSIVSPTSSECDAGLTSVDARRGQQRTMRFCVRDSGPGVPPSRRSLIFTEWAGGGGTRRAFGERDHQLHAGSGLGLPLCCALLQKMSSTLELSDCDDGEGATFSFELTLPQCEPPASSAPASLGTRGAASPGMRGAASGGGTGGETPGGAGKVGGAGCEKKAASGTGEEVRLVEHQL